jgi:FlaG/FlaF family flagellin (archaellin)
VLYPAVPRDLSGRIIYLISVVNITYKFNILTYPNTKNTVIFSSPIAWASEQVTRNIIRKPMIRKTTAGTVPDSGVSEVVGEMLMIALVIVLISVFSATIFNFLPTDRDPSINVMMTNDQQNITLWHKGGDWVKFEDLTVIVGNETNRSSFSTRTGNLILVPNKTVFDLGSNITVQMPTLLEGNETVKLVTPHTVIYTGQVSL